MTMGNLELTSSRQQKHVYSSIADLRAFPSGARRRHTIGVVMNIQPLRHSKAGDSLCPSFSVVVLDASLTFALPPGQPFVTLQIEDPSGQIGVKMFSHVQSSLPLQPKLQIGSVLLLRDLKVRPNSSRQIYFGFSRDR